MDPFMNKEVISIPFFNAAQSAGVVLAIPVV